MSFKVSVLKCRITFRPLYADKDKNTPNQQIDTDVPLSKQTLNLTQQPCLRKTAVISSFYYEIRRKTKTI